MKKYLLLLAFFCSVLCLDGHNVPVTKGVFVGKNLTNSLSITADVYHFDDEVPSVFPDSVNNYLFILSTETTRNGRYLSDERHIHLFDLSNGREMWNRATNRFREKINYCTKGLLVTSHGKTSLLDLQTGKTRWTKKFFTKHIFTRKGLILGYKSAVRKKVANTLKGIDLASGELLWETTLKYRDYWDEVFLMNDTTLLISSEGLHVIHTGNGSGWDYKAKTVTKDYKRAIATTALGVATAVFFGFGIINTQPTETVSLRSNVMVEDSAVYMASHETIARLDLQGHVQWETKLPDDGSFSYIYQKNDSLLMLNFGFGHRNGKKADVGCPYIACFHKSDGNLIFHTKLANDGFPIKDFILTYDGMYILVDDGICHLRTGQSTFSFMPWNTEAHNKLSKFIYNALIYEPDSRSYREVDCSKEGSRIVYNEKGDIFEVNELFEIIRKLDPANVFTADGSWGKYTLMSSPASPVCVFDRQRNKIAEIDLVPRSVQICKDKLFIVSRDNQVYEIDLNQLSDNHFLNTK